MNIIHNPILLTMDLYKIDVETLAASCGVPMRTMYRYITGEAIPQVHIAIRIAQSLNVSLDEIMMVWQ